LGKPWRIHYRSTHCSRGAATDGSPGHSRLCPGLPSVAAPRLQRADAVTRLGDSPDWNSSRKTVEPHSADSECVARKPFRIDLPNENHFWVGSAVTCKHCAGW